MSESAQIRERAEKKPCPICHGARWVCEDHPKLPWGGASNHAEACNCGGAGMPCQCNMGETPEMPAGYRSFVRDEKGKIT